MWEAVGDAFQLSGGPYSLLPVVGAFIHPPFLDGSGTHHQELPRDVRSAGGGSAPAAPGDGRTRAGSDHRHEYFVSTSASACASRWSCNVHVYDYQAQALEWQEHSFVPVIDPCSTTACWLGETERRYARTDAASAHKQGSSRPSAASSFPSSSKRGPPPAAERRAAPHSQRSASVAVTADVASSAKEAAGAAAISTKSVLQSTLTQVEPPFQRETAPEFEATFHGKHNRVRDKETKNEGSSLVVADRHAMRHFEGKVLQLRLNLLREHILRGRGVVQAQGESLMRLRGGRYCGCSCSAAEAPGRLRVPDEEAGQNTKGSVLSLIPDEHWTRQVSSASVASSSGTASSSSPLSGSLSSGSGNATSSDLFSLHSQEDSCRDRDEQDSEAVASSAPSPASQFTTHDFGLGFNFKALARPPPKSKSALAEEVAQNAGARGGGGCARAGLLRKTATAIAEKHKGTTACRSTEVAFERARKEILRRSWRRQRSMDFDFLTFLASTLHSIAASADAEASVGDTCYVPAEEHSLLASSARTSASTKQGAVSAEPSSSAAKNHPWQASPGVCREPGRASRSCLMRDDHDKVRGSPSTPASGESAVVRRSRASDGAGAGNDHREVVMKDAEAILAVADGSQTARGSPIFALKSAVLGCVATRSKDDETDGTPPPTFRPPTSVMVSRPPAPAPQHRRSMLDGTLVPAQPRTPVPPQPGGLAAPRGSAARPPGGGSQRDAPQDLQRRRRRTRKKGRRALSRGLRLPHFCPRCGGKTGSTRVSALPFAARLVKDPEEDCSCTGGAGADHESSSPVTELPRAYEFSSAFSPFPVIEKKLGNRLRQRHFRPVPRQVIAHYGPPMRAPEYPSSRADSEQDHACDQHDEKSGSYWCARSYNVHNVGCGTTSKTGATNKTTIAAGPAASTATKTKTKIAPRPHEVLYPVTTLAAGMIRAEVSEDRIRLARNRQPSPVCGKAADTSAPRNQPQPLPHLFLDPDATFVRVRASIDREGDVEDFLPIGANVLPSHRAEVDVSSASEVERMRNFFPSPRVSAPLQRAVDLDILTPPPPALAAMKASISKDKKDVITFTPPGTGSPSSVTDASDVRFEMQVESGSPMSVKCAAAPDRDRTSDEGDETEAERKSRFLLRPSRTAVGAPVTGTPPASREKTRRPALHPQIAQLRLEDSSDGENDLEDESGAKFSVSLPPAPPVVSTTTIPDTEPWVAKSQQTSEASRAAASNPKFDAASSVGDLIQTFQDLQLMEAPRRASSSSTTTKTTVQEPQVQTKLLISSALAPAPSPAVSAAAAGGAGTVTPLPSTRAPVEVDSPSDVTPESPEQDDPSALGSSASASPPLLGPCPESDASTQCTPICSPEQSCSTSPYATARMLANLARDCEPAKMEIEMCWEPSKVEIEMRCMDDAGPRLLETAFNREEDEESSSASAVEGVTSEQSGAVSLEKGRGSRAQQAKMAEAGLPMYSLLRKNEPSLVAPPSSLAKQGISKTPPASGAFASLFASVPRAIDKVLSTSSPPPRSGLQPSPSACAGTKSNKKSPNVGGGSSASSMPTVGGSASSTPSTAPPPVGSGASSTPPVGSAASCSSTSSCTARDGTEGSGLGRVLLNAMRKQTGVRRLPVDAAGPSAASEVAEADRFKTDYELLLERVQCPAGNYVLELRHEEEDEPRKTGGTDTDFVPRTDFETMRELREAEFRDVALSASLPEVRFRVRLERAITDPAELVLLDDRHAPYLVSLAHFASCKCLGYQRLLCFLVPKELVDPLRYPAALYGGEAAAADLPTGRGGGANAEVSSASASASTSSWSTRQRYEYDDVEGPTKLLPRLGRREYHICETVLVVLPSVLELQAQNTGFRFEDYWRKLCRVLLHNDNHSFWLARQPLLL